ncbi:MAG TPA: pyridoxal phosphate-dependent aminotransferase [Vicinamibacterales bacterium]
MTISFSGRVPSERQPNELTTELAALRATGASVLDLTLSNPTRAGLIYPDRLLQPLAAPEGLRYDPSPFGLHQARSAVAADFARRGLNVPPPRIVLTASTSEAYAVLFKLLCDPGDRVLIPRPSYPLFEYLSRLDGVVASPYELEYHGVWTMDVGALERAITDRTRAVLVVAPNNPTGSFLRQGDLDDLVDLCASRGLAIVGDEVFADYPLDPDPSRAISVLTQDRALTFGLGGLSKSVGLPQLKLAWIGVSGPATIVEEALARLEIICDTYLSVATPVQHAAAALLSTGAIVREQIRDRVLANYASLHALAAVHPACRVLRAEGGWYAVVQVPATRGEDAIVLEVLRRQHVLVHPGYFFDFPREAFLVLSLLPPPDLFAQAAARLLSETDSR